MEEEVIPLFFDRDFEARLFRNLEEKKKHTEKEKQEKIKQFRWTRENRGKLEKEE